MASETTDVDTMEYDGMWLGPDSLSQIPADLLDEFLGPEYQASPMPGPAVAPMDITNPPLHQHQPCQWNIAEVTDDAANLVETVTPNHANGIPNGEYQQTQLDEQTILAMLDNGAPNQPHQDHLAMPSNPVCPEAFGAVPVPETSGVAPVLTNVGFQPQQQLAVDGGGTMYPDAGADRFPTPTAIQPLTATNPVSPQNAMSPDSSTISSANHRSPMGNGHVQKCTFQFHPRMQLRVYYKHVAITLKSGTEISQGSRHEINNPSGFVIYHDRIRPGCIPESAVQFPLEVSRAPDPEKPWLPSIRLTLKDTEIINSICKGMKGGLHVECDNGCIYATRYSHTVVYFWSNDSEIPQTETKKLERKQKTLVFDYTTYLSKVAKLAENRDARILNERLPVIVFTFGFPWVAFF
ncbi:uncharacterized protein [Amphiura filiformis]|uniref:uncharacterized protein n=1 Tax=Amphiura filiformis TaxID=82378 RepID=UPI003B22080C